MQHIFIFERIVQDEVDYFRGCCNSYLIVSQISAYVSQRGKFDKLIKAKHR